MESAPTVGARTHGIDGWTHAPVNHRGLQRRRRSSAASVSARVYRSTSARVQRRLFSIANTRVEETPIAQPISRAVSPRERLAPLSSTPDDRDFTPNSVHALPLRPIPQPRQTCGTAAEDALPRSAVELSPHGLWVETESPCDRVGGGTTSVQLRDSLPESPLVLIVEIRAEHAKVGVDGHGEPHRVR